MAVIITITLVFMGYTSVTLLCGYSWLRRTAMLFIVALQLPEKAKFQRKSAAWF
jgi:hypothetical protein